MCDTSSQKIPQFLLVLEVIFNIEEWRTISQEGLQKGNMNFPYFLWMHWDLVFTSHLQYLFSLLGVVYFLFALDEITFYPEVHDLLLYLIKILHLELYNHILKFCSKTRCISKRNFNTFKDVFSSNMFLHM